MLFAYQKQRLVIVGCVSGRNAKESHACPLPRWRLTWAGCWKGVDRCLGSSSGENCETHGSSGKGNDSPQRASWPGSYCLPWWKDEKSGEGLPDQERRRGRVYGCGETGTQSGTNYLWWLGCFCCSGTKKERCIWLCD